MERQGKKHFFCYLFCASLGCCYFELHSKIKCTSELKINPNLFCTSLGCCYLCGRNSKTSMKRLAFIIGLLLHIMKRLAFFNFLVFTFFIASCTGDKEVRALLERAEALMESHPDSAYAELLHSSSKIEVGDRSAVEAYDFMHLGGSERACYLLLLAEAENKLYMQMPSDTVFQEVVDYYDRHGDANRQLKAYYLMGCIYRDRHEAPMALQWYLDAIEKADTLAADCDYLTLMKVYGQMADIYHSQLMPVEEIDSYRHFSKYAEKAGNTYQTIRGIELQLNAYNLLGDTAMILALTDSVHALYLQNDMPQAAACVYPAAIYIFLAKKDFLKAKQLMDVFEHESGMFDNMGNLLNTTYNYYCAKGMYYQGIHKLDSAAYFYHRLQQCGHLMSSYNGLFSVYWQEQNMDSVAKYSLLYRESVKANAATQQQEAMVKVKSLYDYTRQQKIASQKEIELIHRTNLIIYIIIGVVLLSVWLFVWFIRKNRAEKEALRKKEQLFDNTLKFAKALLATKERELEELSQQNLSLEERERQLHQEIADSKSRIKALESSTPFQEMLPHNQEEEMLTDPIVGMFHHSAVNPVKTQQLVPENWNELNQLIEQSLPRLYALIVNNVFLNTEQKRMVFLVRLHFKNNEIMNLLDLGSPQRVTNKIAKLNQLLYGKRSARDFYDNLKNMLPKY